MISADLLKRVLSRLALPGKPAATITGLNQVYAAYCASVPNDNLQKRIWLVGDQSAPVPGGEPAEFFESWLAYGTGGTCFPSNGALCELLSALGFKARRYLGAVMMEGLEHDGNHGTVLVTLDGADYLVDAQLAAFGALPLARGRHSSTGNGIHDISAVPVADGFHVLWYPGSNRKTPLVMEPDLKGGAVEHSVFLERYALSASRIRKRSPFNDAVFIGRHFPDRIVVVSRTNKTEVTADNVATRHAITLADRTKILVDELGISPELVGKLPPDEEARPA